MQTVNFLCGHCSKLMAVGITSLGMQVRCPHCQQIVVAPANAPQPPAPVHVPLYGEGIMEDHPIEEESIFSRPVPVDDLFDDPPPAPALLEIPPAPAVSSPTGPRQVEATPPEEPESQASTAVSEESNLASLASDGIGHGTVRVSAPRRYQATGRNWMLWALILPLVSYAILSTILMIILYNQYRNAVQNNDKLFLLPDEGGDNPGVRKNKGAWKWEINPRIYRQPLPPGLLTTLHKGQEGQTLHLGDLAVTPMKVEQKVIRVFVEGSRLPEPCQNPSLVLTLRLRNNASDYAFVPLENYFDRHFAHRTEEDVYAPLTLLEVGASVFHGGPAHWAPRVRPKNRPDRCQWVEGRKKEEQDLEPGQQIETFVCTDGNNDEEVKAISNYQGTFLWRVHLRRGLVTHKGSEYSRTAVIGVQFRREDVEGMTP